MTKSEVAKQYIHHLDQGNIAHVIALFAKDGQVHSPIYGIQPAREFYTALSNDTTSSELHLDGIFEESQANRLALYFTYHWTLKSGESVTFEVVDIITFNAMNQITTLKIIYDTHITRQLVEKLKK
ncbi:MAG TPA: hypothetical protein DCS93_05070 [Microscillaceae bacterium]|nr:hypothetical protein [Microscillaceae bacterium]